MPEINRFFGITIKCFSEITFLHISTLSPESSKHKLTSNLWSLLQEIYRHVPWGWLSSGHHNIKTN